MTTTREDCTALAPALGGRCSGAVNGERRVVQRRYAPKVRSGCVTCKYVLPLQQSALSLRSYRVLGMEANAGSESAVSSATKANRLAIGVRAPAGDVTDMLRSRVVCRRDTPSEIPRL